MKMESTYARSLKRLRGLREATGLTLKQLEIRSRGKWKAVVVGSYERGTRHLSLKRAIDLCDFYGADISDLGSPPSQKDKGRIILDLSALNELRNLPDELSQVFGRIAGRITLLRGDRNGTVLSIRAIDLEYLELVLGMNSQELLDGLQVRGLLLSQKN